MVFLFDKIPKLYIYAIFICIIAMLMIDGGINALPLKPNPTDIEYKRYCSNTLSEAIKLICNGRTNSLGHKFPDSVGHRSGGLNKRFAPDEIFYRPLQNGPIHECCRRPCGYDELKQYCAPD